MSTDLILTEKNSIKDGMIRWRAPSNIALIKYWGKRDFQLPQNPSLSLTLNDAHTETSLFFKRKKNMGHDGGRDISLDFFFQDERWPSFEQRVKQYLQGLLIEYPFLSQLNLTIKTRNNFPHSAGVASSASGMAALALCLVSLEVELFKSFKGEGPEFFEKASRLARLGSGSACRSIYGGIVLWGKTSDSPNSSDEYACSLTPFASSPTPRSLFYGLKDAILLLETKSKNISSSVGHGLMRSNPYASMRFREARKNLKKLLKALESDCWVEAGNIIEAEAFALHGLMALSHPPYLLMAPKTLEFIEALKKWREKNGALAYFTLDAGPNVHLIYREQDAFEVENWLKTEFDDLYKREKIIFDKMGKGPVKL